MSRAAGQRRACPTTAPPASRRPARPWSSSRWKPAWTASRYPRPPQSSWPTVRPTSGRTPSSSPCRRRRTRSGRRSSSAPSSDSAAMRRLLSGVPRGAPHAHSSRAPPLSLPVPAQPPSLVSVSSVPWFSSLP